MRSSHSLKHSFERQRRSFGKNLHKTRAGELEPLHQCRVATRRLRELLRLCASDLPRGTVSRARRRVRRFGRALGDVRELDVSICLIGELVDADRLQPAAAVRLRQYLDDERNRRRRRMAGRVSPKNVRKVERDLAEVAKALGMKQQGDRWSQVLALRITRRAQHVRDAVVEAASFYVAERVHTVRITTKKLRYVLEFARETGDGQTKTATSQLKSIQDMLGRLHDLEVLQKLIQSLLIPADQQHNWALQLEVLRLDLAGECRRLHGDFVATQPALLEICQGAFELASKIWIESGCEGPTGRVLKRTLRATASSLRVVNSA